MKGLLTLAMILCHCLQFFGKEDTGIEKILVNVDQPHAFSGFLFCFGFVLLSGLFSGGHKAWNRPYASEYDQASAGVLYFRSRLYGILRSRRSSGRILSGRF